MSVDLLQLDVAVASYHLQLHAGCNFATFGDCPAVDAAGRCGVVHEVQVRPCGCTDVDRGVGLIQALEGHVDLWLEVVLQYLEAFVLHGLDGTLPTGQILARLGLSRTLRLLRVASAGDAECDQYNDGDAYEFYDFTSITNAIRAGRDFERFELEQM